MLRAILSWTCTHDHASMTSISFDLAAELKPRSARRRRTRPYRDLPREPQNYHGFTAAAES